MTAPRQGACSTRYPRRTTALSPTQQAIAACLVDAMTNMEIADAVGINSEKSVASHIERMRDKLQARNRTHLALILDRQTRAAA